MSAAVAPGRSEPVSADDRGHRLILVREQDAQHSGSGCCGRLGEAHTALGGAADFSHSRALMEDIGVVYRRLRAERPGLAIEIVDPRNTLWLYPAVWRASGRAGFSFGRRLAQLARAGAASSVILDGEVLFSGALPHADTVVDKVISRLDDRCEH